MIPDWIAALVPRALPPGTAPLRLDDPARVLWAELGALDLFLVRPRGGAFERRPFVRIEAGGSVWGLVLAGGWSLEAVPLAGSQIHELDRGRLLDAASTPEGATPCEELLAGWLRALYARQVDDLPQLPVVSLVPGDRTVCESAARLMPRTRLVWLEVLAGTLNLAGGTSLSPAATLGLADNAHAAAGEGMEAQIRATVDLAKLGLLAPSLQATTGLLGELLLRQMAEGDRREWERLAARSEADRRQLAQVAREFRGILAPEGARYGPGGGDPLLEACRIVGGAQGIEFKSPPAQMHALGGRDPLGEMVRASGVRSRAVTLRSGWWRGDHGPLLGFLGEELFPVALMPTPAGGYEIRDPSGAQVVPVDAATAGRIAPTAYAFYRTFGAAAVKVADLLRFAGRGLRRDFTWIAVMGGLGGLVGLVGPYLNQPLFDDAIPNAERAQVLQIVFALLGAALAGAMFNVTQSLSVLRVEGSVDQAAQAGVWDRLLRLPAPFFRRYTAGDLTLRAGAVGAIRAAVAGTTVNGLLAAIFSLTSLALLLSLSLPLAALTLVLALLLVVLMLPGTWLKLRLERGVADAGGRLSGTVFQLLTGVAKLRVSAAEGRAFALWARQYARQERMVLRVGFTEAYLNVVLTVFPLVASMALFLAVAATRGAGRMSTGEFLAFNAAFGTFLGGATGIFYALTDALEAMPLYERLAPILETETESPAGRANPGLLTGRIELLGVSFRYGSESPQVLHDVSLEVRPGEFVAIVGASGSGKSTLLRLLLGFERPTAGTVFYDGQDLSGLDIGAVRRQMGVVLQNGQLLGGDIYTSVSGVAQLPVAEVLDALRACGLEEDVQAMPMGVYTVLPEGGSTLSGGQRQRLMLARAVATRPRLLLLDEATSALDNRSQAIVTASMEALKITRVVIAHRLSTIVNADRIYVLDAGRVVQRGTYAELMAEDGLFRRLASRQTIETGLT